MTKAALQAENDRLKREVLTWKELYYAAIKHDHKIMQMFERRAHLTP